MDDDPLKILGRFVMARRLELDIKRSKDLATKVGVSSRVITDIERGNRRVGAATYRSLEGVLGWMTGSVEVVLDHGREPVPADSDAADPEAMTWDDFDQLGPRLSGIDRQLESLWSRIDDLEEEVRQLRGQPGGGAMSARQEGGEADGDAASTNEPPDDGGAGTDDSGSGPIVKRYLDQADGDPATAASLLAHDGAKGANVDVFTWTAALEELHRLEQEAADKEAARGEDTETPKLGDD